jgi:mitochondrial GTPase 1
MLQRGGAPDLPRAAGWFVRCPSGWGLDFEWLADANADMNDAAVLTHMERCIDRFMVEGAREEEGGGAVSATQEKKRIRDERQAKRLAKARTRT